MQRVDELDLPVMPIGTAEFAKDPFTGFKVARERHPWVARADVGGYVITEHDAIRDFLLMDDRLRAPLDFVIDLMQAEGSHWARFQRESLLGLSAGPTHRRIRDVVAPAFTPRAANRHRDLMREVIARVLDEWVPKGKFDFEEFASYFPISVMCRLVGAPAEKVRDLRSSLEAIGLSMNLIPDFLPQLEQATLYMENYLEQLVADRRAGQRLSPEHDLLDALLEVHDSGGLSGQELTSLLIFLFVAGYDTSKNVLTMIMHEMLSRPAMYERCAEDMAYCHKVIEEGLRFQSPGTSSRQTNEDILYRGVVFPKDVMLFLPNGMASRDPGAFPDPDTFDPDRPNAERHMAFGRGIHICLGQYLARAQIEEGFHMIAQRIRNPKLAGSYGFRPFPGVWGFKGMPIEFTPAPARKAKAPSSALAK